MGRWGYYPFDNDTGADFSADIDAAPESSRIEMLQDALSSVAQSGNAHVDGGRAEVAIAAAAIVARDLIGGEEFQSPVWGPECHIPQIPEDVILIAAEAIDRLLEGDNDVKDDWIAELSGAADWFAMMQRLHRVLAGDDVATSEERLW